MPKWQTDEINLLGTMTDSALAKRIGRSRKAVETMRLSLEIPAHTAHQRKWSKREVAMLGVLPDGAIAKKLKISRRCVLMERKRRGIATARPNSTPKKFRKQLATTRRTP